MITSIGRAPPAADGQAAADGSTPLAQEAPAELSRASLKDNTAGAIYVAAAPRPSRDKAQCRLARASLSDSEHSEFSIAISSHPETHRTPRA
jgi:hypothetical protein